MQIALDATYSVDRHPSGIAVYSSEILNGLARRHAQDSYIHYYRPKQFSHAPSPGPTKRRLLPWGSLHKADIFHALNQRCDRRLGHKVLTTFHDLFVLTNEYSSPDFRQRFAKQAHLAARNSDRIIAVSQFTANQVHELLKIERSRITVVPHGVHMPLRDLPRSEENMILTVGAVQLRKNTARLVEAFESLPGDWNLVIAGAASGYGADAILQRIEGSSAKERIQVAGYVSSNELQRLYSRAAIFAFPSLDEGFGIPVLEAMAYGVPVVTSNRSALPEVAADAALLVDPSDSAEIAAALSRLIDDASLRSKLSAAGRLRAQAFPWDRAVDQTYAVYAGLMSARA